MFANNRQVHGRAIIDFYTGARRNDAWRKSVKSLDDADDQTTQPSGKSKAAQKSTGKTAATGTFDTPIQRPSKETQEMNKKLVETDDVHLLLMSPLLHGFSLVSKKWSKCLQHLTKSCRGTR